MFHFFFTQSGRMILEGFPSPVCKRKPKAGSFVLVCIFGNPKPFWSRKGRAEGGMEGSQQRGENCSGKGSHGDCGICKQMEPRETLHAGGLQQWVRTGSANWPSFLHKSFFGFCAHELNRKALFSVLCSPQFFTERGDLSTHSQM